MTKPRIVDIQVAVHRDGTPVGRRAPRDPPPGRGSDVAAVTPASVAVSQEIHEHRCVHCGKTPSEAGVAKCEPIPQATTDHAPIGWAQVVILRLGLSLSDSETRLLERAFSESRAEERERCAAIVRRRRFDEHATVMVEEMESDADEPRLSR